MLRVSGEDWQRKKSYLVRSLFEDIPLLSPIYEAHEPVSQSSDSDRPESPLPDLIIETIKKRNPHDEPEEFYVKLQKEMRRLYERDFLNIHHSTSSADTYILEDDSLKYIEDDSIADFGEEKIEIGDINDDTYVEEDEHISVLNREVVGSYSEGSDDMLHMLTEKDNIRTPQVIENMVQAQNQINVGVNLSKHVQETFTRNEYLTEIIEEGMSQTFTEPIDDPNSVPENIREKESGVQTHKESSIYSDEIVAYEKESTLEEEEQAGVMEEEEGSISIDEVEKQSKILVAFEQTEHLMKEEEQANILEHEIKTVEKEPTKMLEKEDESNCFEVDEEQNKAMAGEYTSSVGEGQIPQELEETGSLMEEEPETLDDEESRDSEDIRNEVSKKLMYSPEDAVVEMGTHPLQLKGASELSYTSLIYFPEPERMRRRRSSIIWSSYQNISIDSDTSKESDDEELQGMPRDMEIADESPDISKALSTSTPKSTDRSFTFKLKEKRPRNKSMRPSKKFCSNKALQTSYSDEEDVPEFWKNFFVGEPVVFKVCPCVDHVCS